MGDKMGITVKSFESKAEMYAYITSLLPTVTEEADSIVSVLANSSALLNMFLKNINWVGFYLLQDEVLKLGPFQGKPAVTRIEIGQGVCGAAALEKKTQIIDNVHECDNHIACDISSASEIVLPMMAGEKLIGVLDIDSPQKARFDDEDKRGLELFVSELLKYI